MLKWLFSPLIKRYQKSRKERFESMMLKVPNLSDDELKSWYACADTQMILGDICQDERKLLSIIEDELNKRGFQYQLDY